VSQSLHSNSVQDVKVIDSGSNLSDHCPLILNINIPNIKKLPGVGKNRIKHQMQVTYRWDLGDIMQYYALTGELLMGIDVPMHLLSNGSIGDTLNAVEEINSFYNNIVFSLQKASYASIPRKKHNF